MAVLIYRFNFHYVFLFQGIGRTELYCWKKYQWSVTEGYRVSLNWSHSSHTPPPQKKEEGKQTNKNNDSIQIMKLSTVIYSCNIENVEMSYYLTPNEDTNQTFIFLQ